LINLLLAGCSLLEKRIIIAHNPISLPIKPKWPGLDPADFQCISQTTWEEVLMLRNLRRNQYEHALEQLILSTHKK